MNFSSKTLRIYTSVHTWAGLIAGMALFIAFYAGAITLFHPELHFWSDPELRGTRPEAVPTAQALLDDVAAKEPKSHARLNVLLDGAYGAETMVYWYDEERGEWLGQGEPGATPEGEDDSHHSHLADIVNHLHFTLGLPEGVGIYLMGVVSIIYALAIISGLIIHLPHLLSDTFALRQGRNLKRFWQDAHNVIGVLSLPFHAMYAITGALLTISVLFFAAYNFLVLDNQIQRLLTPMTSLSPEREASGTAAPMLPLDQLIERARREVPAIETGLITFQRYGDDTGVAIVRGLVDGVLLREAIVTLEADSGEVIDVQQPGARKPYWSAVGGIVAFHYATFGDLALRAMYFVLGLGGAFLFYSGNLLWIESRRKRRQAEQPRVHVWLARATIGVCIGSMLGISALFLSVHLLPEAAQPRPAWEWRVYYASFFAAILWAALRPPARAAIELLWTCAAVTLAIPLANGVVTGDHLLRAALHGEWAVFAVDATAIAMALGFVAMARATARRARRGDPNSVWAMTDGADTAAAARVAAEH